MSVRIPSPGALFAGRYRIDSVLGHGAMGVVLSANDEKTGVDCAIKVLTSPELGNDRARLVREARALMLIASPHVIRVFDVGDDEAGPYLVLEKLEGQDLGALAPMGQPIEAERVVAYMIQVCDALAAAHAVEVIHRDIKPSNLFLAETPAGPTIKVLDFGISKVSAGDGQGSLTRPDGPLGSPQFISPEQLENPKNVDAQTDIWSVGVVMYRLLSGEFPFNGTTVGETFALVSKGKRPTLHDVAPDVPLPLVAIVERCLSRDPKARPTAVALKELLLAPPAAALTEEDYFESAPTAPMPPHKRPTPPPPRRSWGAFAFGAILAIGGGYGVLRAMRHDAKPEPSPPPVTIESATPSAEPEPLVSATPIESAPRPQPKPRPTHKKPPEPAPATTELRKNPYRN